MHVRMLLAAGVIALAAGCSSAPPQRATTSIELFNGVDLSGWHADVPRADEDPTLPA